MNEPQEFLSLVCAGSSDESGVAPHGAADFEAVSGVSTANCYSASAVGGVINGGVGQPASSAPTFDGGELPIRVSPAEAGTSRSAAREKRFYGRKTVTSHFLLTENAGKRVNSP
jgi:hypothetical protein